jgi:hypothetical protein
MSTEDTVWSSEPARLGYGLSDLIAVTTCDVQVCKAVTGIIRDFAGNAEKCAI